MGLLSSLSWVEITILGLAGAVGYVGATVIYRIWFSPIANFPGPLLAKTTFWYEFYYTWVKLGQYHLVIRDMHRKYGPIVRVTPNELHVADPTFYHQLYVSSAVRKSESYPRFSEGTGFEDMTAISTSHDMHRQARAPLEPFFSPAGIVRVEPRVAARVEKLCQRLAAMQGTGKMVNLTYAMSSLTTDVISSIIFEEPSDYLGDPDFNKEWFDTLKRGTLSVPIFANLPWLTKLAAKPTMKYLFERFTRWRIWDDKARRQILKSRLRPSDEAKTRDDTTVFDHLVHSDLVEAQFGKTGFARLAQLIQQAGAHNVSHSLGTILTYMLLDRSKTERLRQEVAEVYERCGDKEPTWRDLEKSPYLTGVVKEGLRVAIGGMNRSPRVSPEDDLEFQDWIIPKKTAVSMSSYWLHIDPDVFPDPHAFKPERWMVDSAQLKVMNSYYVPFAKGSRNCLGQNLVHMQMYLTVARLFRPGAPDIVLYETDESDVRAVHGLLFPLPRLDSKGVRALVC